MESPSWIRYLIIKSRSSFMILILSLYLNGELSLFLQDTVISHAANVAVNEIFDLLYIHVKNQVKNGKKTVTVSIIGTQWEIGNLVAVD